MLAGESNPLTTLPLFDRGSGSAQTFEALLRSRSDRVPEPEEGRPPQWLLTQPRTGILEKSVASPDHKGALTVGSDWRRPDKVKRVLAGRRREACWAETIMLPLVVRNHNEMQAFIDGVYPRGHANQISAVPSPCSVWGLKIWVRQCWRTSLPGGLHLNAYVARERSEVCSAGHACIRQSIARKHLSSSTSDLGA